MSNTENILVFENKLNSIYDTNLGDYQRKAQTYLNRLKQSLNSPSPELIIEIKKLENYISFAYNQDLDTAILTIRNSIMKMRGIEQ